MLTILPHSRPDWPLLGKELLEQASRKQMYVLRVTYALLLFGAFSFYYIRNLGEGPVLTLGRGLGPFWFLVTAQLGAIYMFLPPLMAGALTQEKERDTLGLLFLTDLTPWELILQKYVGRLIPMLTLLLLSLPLLAVAYSLGGVSAGLLCSSAVTLFLTCLAVGALALECSAHEATTFQALVRCWGLCAVFATCCSITPFRFRLVNPTTLPPSPSPFDFTFPVIFSAAIYLLPALFFLVRAKQILEARAFVARRNPFGYQFRQIDQYWRDLRKLVRAISRTRDPEAHALAEQVVRRHLAAATNPPAYSLSRFLLARMQVPNLLAFSIIIGVIAIIFLCVGVFLDGRSAVFSVVVTAIWILALLTIPIQSANVVGRERMNGRLDPILTAPLTGQEILNEWLGPVRRWIRFLARPLLVVVVAEALVKYWIHLPADIRWTHASIYLGISLPTVWLYPRLAQWLCLWIGLRTRNQVRALLASFLAAAAWCVVPAPLGDYLEGTGLLSAGWNRLLQFVSPVTVIQSAESLGTKSTIPFLPLEIVILAAAHFVLVAGLTWIIRQTCLRNVDRYLGRV